MIHYLFSTNASPLIGGQEATNGQFPYQVLLRVCQTSQHICDGAILNKRWIMSATQCTRNRSIDANVEHTYKFKRIH